MLTIQRPTWHVNLQSKFQKAGCKIEVRVQGTNHKKYRQGDILNSGGYILELQHSPISREEIENRRQDYLSQGYSNVYWLIDGITFAVIQRFSDNRFLLSLQYPWLNISDIFAQYEFIFAHIIFETEQFVIKFDPRTVRNGMVYVLNQYKYSIQEFIEKFSMNNIDLSEIPTGFRPCQMIVQQKPAGSGKTFGMVERILKCPDFDHYNNFFILTKPHSAKDVIRREFESQLSDNKIEYESGEENKAFWFLLQVKNEQKLIILATGDSFIYRIGEKSNEYLDMFKGICKMIETKGPTRLGGYGSMSWKGHNTKINARTLIVCDEATKFDVHYASAIGHIMFWCMADALIIGDSLQSIEFEHNMLTYLINTTDDPFHHIEKVIEKDNVIRRFGSRLVHSLNTILGINTYKKYGLPVPISCDDGTIRRDHEGEIEIMILDMNSPTAEKENHKLRLALDQIMHKIECEIEALYLLPNDILIIFPFVSNNPFGDFFRDRLDELWIDKLEDPRYRQHMLNSPYTNREKIEQYFKKFDEIKDKKNHYKKQYELVGRQYDWHAYFHRSEEGKPVTTSDSDQATRMVSIHAAQGDGRRLVLACQLSEYRLKRFSNGKKNLIYDSLLNVACSRAKTKQIIILQLGESDDIVSRFKPFMSSDQLYHIRPKLHIFPSFFINTPLFDAHEEMMDKQWIQDVFDIEYECPQHKNQIIESEHHIIRDCTFNFVFMLCAWDREREFISLYPQIYTIICKICELPIVQVNVSEYHKILNDHDDLSCMPILRYKHKIKICDNIFKICEDIKGRILKPLAQGDCLINIKHITPLEYVLLWYMIQVFTLKKYSHPKMSTVIDIYSMYKTRYNDDMISHYNCIDKAQSTFNKITKSLPTNGKWNFNHRISLGKSDGESPDSDFRCKMVLPFVYTSDDSCTVIHIMPNISPLRLDEIATIVSYTGLLISQPYQSGDDKHKQSGRNKVRFDGKHIRIYLPSIEEIEKNTKPLMFEWKDSIENYRTQIINVLSMSIFQQQVSQHDNIIEFVKYYKHESCNKYKESCKKSGMPSIEYIVQIMDWYCEELEDCKIDKISELEDKFRKKLEKKLIGAVDSFTKSLG